MYKGVIIEEGLTDSRILNNFQITGVDITTEDDPNDRWHMYEVMSDRETILDLSRYMKKSGYYAHFWKGDDLIVVFSGKIVEFNKDDENLRNEAISYGQSVGIPLEQLDFITD